MSTENDTFLQAVIQGNILQGLEILHADSQSDSGKPLGLNKLLYGHPDQAALEVIREAEARLTESLDALEDTERATAYYNLGCYALLQDEIMTARERFAVALELAPEHLMARHNLAYAQELLAEIDQARENYRIILAQKPDCVLTRLNLAQLQLQEENLEGAVQELASLNQNDGQNRGLLLFYCRALLTRAQPEDVQKAIELLSGLPNLNNYPDLYECQAFAWFLNEDFESAEQAYSELLTENEENLFARVGMIKILSEKGDLEGMQPHVEYCQAHNPDEKMADLLEALQARD